ncbi:MAG: NAD(P)H-dependent oxidoreductase subunit E [Planctomycetes bacterium]|nr:NAD(P)H-dependent oxidoreductase subunit E [Planctomycetota bacterium]
MSKNLIALQNKFLGHGQTVYDLLSNLHDAQGFITDDDILRLANDHNLPPQHVRSTAKFYEELSHDKPSKHVLKVCNGEACRAAGCTSIEKTMCAEFGVEMGQTSTDGVRVEHVACLGYCGIGPNVMIDSLPLSLANKTDIPRVIDHAHGKKPHGLTEPTNAIHLPAAGKPRVLTRYFDRDVVPLDKARTAGIYKTLEKAVTRMTPQQVIDQIDASKLRGRGGAGFPTGTKLRTVATSPSDSTGRKFVVVNFDEGDAGSYIDKELVERDPHTQLEGILLAAYATGAQEAIIYARFEYPRARAVLAKAIEEARAAWLIGVPLFGSSFQCSIRIVRGQGAYICGEETSLLRSIEGLPALVSTRPPFPAQKGLWGCPTAVHNVETIHNLPWIIEHDGDAYAKFGHGRSRGTKAVSLNARVKRPGFYEVELGITLRQLIFDLAGGMADGQTFKAIQIGGPLGGILPESKLDTKLDFEALAAAKGILGHAGVVVYSQNDNLVEICRGLMEFCAIESCGKCFPCRIGSVRGTELFDQMMDTASPRGGVTDVRLNLLTELCETMKYGSLCALGGMIPAPIECLMEYFPQELDRYRKAGEATREGALR